MRPPGSQARTMSRMRGRAAAFTRAKSMRVRMEPSPLMPSRVPHQIDVEAIQINEPDEDASTSVRGVLKARALQELADAVVARVQSADRAFGLPLVSGGDVDDDPAAVLLAQHVEGHPDK